MTSGIMGNVGNQILKRKKNVRNKKGNVCSIYLFFCCFKLSIMSPTAMLDQGTAFWNLAPILPTMQLSQWVTSLEAIDLLLPEPQKTSYYFFHICSNTPQDL